MNGYTSVQPGGELHHNKSAGEAPFNG